MQRLSLGTYPTPVEPLATLSRAGCALWVKRDDRTSALYGGNKVRKLERILARAKARGAERIVTVGAVGSHHVLATAVFARREGLLVDAVLVPQPSTPHVIENVRADVALGVNVVPASSYAHAAWLVATRLGRGAYYVPVGGSNAVGALGYVDAARELAAQVKEGAMPEPDVVVVTLGSGGTAAGLAAGFALEGMKTRVVAVSVSDPAWLVARAALRLARACVRSEKGSVGRLLDGRIEVDRRYLGKGYGHATPAADRALAIGATAGLALDLTYTAKTFAAALDRVEAGTDAVVLYWHTLSSVAMDALLVGAPREEDLDEKIQRLLR